MITPERHTNIDELIFISVIKYIYVYFLNLIQKKSFAYQESNKTKEKSEYRRQRNRGKNTHDNIDSSYKRSLFNQFLFIHVDPIMKE